MMRMTIMLTGIEDNIKMFVNTCLISEYQTATYEIQPDKGELKKLVIKDDESNIFYIKKKAKMYGIS